MRLARNYKDRFVNGIHLNAMSFFAKQNIFKNNDYKLTSALSLPLGFLLYLFLKHTQKKGIIK